MVTGSGRRDPGQREVAPGRGRRWGRRGPRWAAARSVPQQQRHMSALETRWRSTWWRETRRRSVMEASPARLLVCMRPLLSVISAITQPYFRVVSPSGRWARPGSGCCLDLVACPGLWQTSQVACSGCSAAQVTCDLVPVLGPCSVRTNRTTFCWTTTRWGDTPAARASRQLPEATDPTGRTPPRGTRCAVCRENGDTPDLGGR